MRCRYAVNTVGTRGLPFQDPASCSSSAMRRSRVVQLFGCTSPHTVRRTVQRSYELVHVTSPRCSAQPLMPRDSRGEHHLALSFTCSCAAAASRSSGCSLALWCPCTRRTLPRCRSPCTATAAKHRCTGGSAPRPPKRLALVAPWWRKRPCECDDVI